MRYAKMRLSSGSTNVDLPFRDVDPTNPFVCKDIAGLGPTEIDVTLSSPINQPGSIQSRVPQNRQVVATVGLAPDYSVGQTSSDLRDVLYDLLDPVESDTIRVAMWSSTGELLYAYGTIAKVEPAIFSKDPEVVVTIDCLSPYWASTTAVSIVAPTWSKSAPVIVNTGKASVGFFMDVVFTSEILTSWTLTDSDSSGTKKMVINKHFFIGDTLHIDTRPGSLALDYTFPGNPTESIASSLSDDSVWLQLHRGNNNLTTSNAGFNWGPFGYQPLYRGI